MTPAPRLQHLGRTVAAAVLARLELIKKAGSFAAIGVVNTAVDFGVFVVAYQYLGVPLVPANLLAWLIAVSGSYVMNSAITFASVTGRKLRVASYGKFVASGFVGVIANTMTLVILSYVIPVLVAKIIAIGVAFFINFSLSHFVVFRPADPPADRP